MKVIRKHVPSGSIYEFDMPSNYEFIRRYGFMNARNFRLYAEKLVQEWNSSSRQGSDKQWHYEIID